MPQEPPELDPIWVAYSNSDETSSSSEDMARTVAHEIAAERQPPPPNTTPKGSRARPLLTRAASVLYPLNGLKPSTLTGFGQLTEADATGHLWRRQQELNDEQTAQLLGLISDKPHLFRRPDGKGIAPVHWLCGSPAVTESHLMALLDADATLARCRDSRGILPLHWSACETARTQRAAATPLCRFAHLAPPPSPGSARTTR